MIKEDDLRDSLNEKPSTIRYVLGDFARGVYALLAVVIDVFVIFQVYVWFPTVYAAVLLAVGMITISIAEYRLYFALKSVIHQLFR